ncbi:uncharacterized protein LOC119837164 [Zerene cesonia]|uniref:uncharacterized protein LOC119837164 n=1 Tax=Zerene cesonia TaxID=33412 RepID=UPI0018E59D97|nr:uncharacterized protein LOC119837164 [Zerene cesonia]
MIDISDDEEVNKKCFKYRHKLTDSLNIIYNASNSTLCLWNKYQIFIHEHLNFEDAAKIIIPEFQIRESLLIDNYLLCLDYSNNVHLISLKFKHSATKRLKSSFSPRDQNILTMKNIGSDVICLKQENGICYICSYRMKVDFQLTRNQEIPLKNKFDNKECLLYLHALSLQEFDTIKEMFNCQDCAWKDHYLIIISFDKMTMFSCLFTYQDNNEVTFIKLYVCPTEIADVKILNRNHPQVLIALSSGTIIKLDLNKEKSHRIVHMNSSIDKFQENNDSMLYSDGAVMWKADDIYENNISFRQLFVKQVKDFVKCNDQIVCTTYTKFIYIFPIDDESSYLKPVTNEEYCSAELLLNNTHYLERILHEVNKMEELIKEINEEKNHVTALALSNKQDLMDTIIHYKVTVFDDYHDILNIDNVLIYADDPKDIFRKDSYYFLINITTSHLQHNFKEILSNLFGDLRIHITLLTDENILKTTTVKVQGELKKIDIVVALRTKYLDLKKKFFINLQLVTRIPGVLDIKQNLWTCLHEKYIPLTSEYFIQRRKTSKHVYLKKNGNELKDLIFETVDNRFGTLFSIAKNPMKIRNEWVFYVKLPSDYKQIFNTCNMEDIFDKRKCEYIKELISSEDFLKSQTTLQFSISNEKANIEILNDGFSRPVLKVSSTHAKVALDIRNFMAQMLSNGFVGLPQEMVVNWSLYSVVETLQRAVKDCLMKRNAAEEFFDLHHTFQRNIIANLPISHVFYFSLEDRPGFARGKNVA